MHSGGAGRRSSGWTPKWLGTRRVRDARGARRSFQIRDPSLPFDQSSVQASAQADSRDGREPPAPGRAGLVRSGLLDALPQAEIPRRANPLSPCRRAADSAGAPSGHCCAMPCRVTDSTGIKFLCGDEWQARKHAVQSRRQWCKVLLAMDTATSDIRAVEFTPSREGDSPVLPELLGQIPEDEDIGAVTADGACDTRRSRSAVIARGGKAIIPIRRNGRAWKEDCPAAKARNETLRATRHYGRAFWKRSTGYHARSRVEAKMRCLKAFGEHMAARDPDRQTAEITSGSLLSIASTRSAPPRSSAWPEPERRRGTHASGYHFATTPYLALLFPEVGKARVGFAPNTQTTTAPGCLGTPSRREFSPSYCAGAARASARRSMIDIIFILLMLRVLERITDHF